MGKGRPDLFPPDRGLQARMVLTLMTGVLLTLVYGTIMLAIVVALFFVPDHDARWLAAALVGLPLCFLLAGWVGSRRSGPADGTREPTPDDEKRVRRVTERLCGVADLDPPDTNVVADRLPLSWTSAPPWRRPRIHLSTGMLDALPERELQAVVAHELSHIVHRDAVVMSLVATPSVYVLRGLRHMASDEPIGTLCVIAMGFYFVLPALVLGLLGRILSRHRELAADRSAARLTGSPAALGSALVRLREDMIGGDVLLMDLKLAAPRNQFHVIPVEKRERGGLRRVWASHPRLQDRLDALGRMERELQTVRGTAPRALEVA